MRAPMGIVALALAAGIVLDWGLRPGPFWIAGLLAVSGAAVGFLRRWTGWANLSLVFLLIGSGALRAELDRREPPPAFGPVALEGRLSGDPELSRDGRSFAAWFRLESAGLIQVRLPSRAGQFRYGERLKLYGMLRPGRTSDLAKGGRFDERRWLWVHGAGGVLSVTGREGIVRLEERLSLWTRYRRWVARLRQALANQGRLLLAPEQAGLLEALMLGEGRGIRPEIWEAFRKTGTLHVLVVSGSHVGLIGLISLTGLAILRTPRAARALLLGGILITYCLLTGSQPPILRATLAGLLLCWGSFRGLEISQMNLLGAAGAVILLAQPRALADAGCQLSFAAVAGILWVDCWVKKVTPVRRTETGFGTSYRVRYQMIQAVVVSCAACAATSPLIAWHFGMFSPAAPLANLIVVPWASLLVAVGALVFGLGLLAPWAAGPFAAAFAVLARGLSASVQWAAGLPGVFWTW